MTTSDDRYLSSGMQKMAAVVEALAAATVPLSATELADRTGESRNTCFRVARNLQLCGWAEAAPQGGWRLTGRLWRKVAAPELLRMTLADSRDVNREGS